jgi:hypothetical protein
MDETISSGFPLNMNRFPMEALFPGAMPRANCGEENGANPMTATRGAADDSRNNAFLSFMVDPLNYCTA